MRPELQGVIEVAEEGTDGEEETVMCGQPVAENLEEIGQEEKKERKKANEAAGAGRRVGKEGMMCRSSALAEAGQEEGTKPMTRAMWRRLEQRQRGEGDGSSRVPRPQREEEGLQVCSVGSLGLPLPNACCFKAKVVQYTVKS